MHVEAAANTDQTPPHAPSAYILCACTHITCSHTRIISVPSAPLLLRPQRARSQAPFQVAHVTRLPGSIRPVCTCLCARSVAAGMTSHFFPRIVALLSRQYVRKPMGYTKRSSKRGMAMQDQCPCTDDRHSFNFQLGSRVNISWLTASPERSDSYSLAPIYVCHVYSTSSMFKSCTRKLARGQISILSRFDPEAQQGFVAARTRLGKSIVWPQAHRAAE